MKMTKHKKLKSIREYLFDKGELIEQMFSSLPIIEIRNMVPIKLQGMPLHELKAECLVELLGMSDGEIVNIFEGCKLDFQSSSESEAEGVLIISDEEKIIKDEKRRERSSAPKSGHSFAEQSSAAKKEKRRRSDDVTATKTKKRKVGEKVPLRGRSNKNSSNSEVRGKAGSLPVVVLSDTDSVSSRDESRGGEKSLLDLLELEMRARAIRSLLKKEEDAHARKILSEYKDEPDDLIPVEVELPSVELISDSEDEEPKVVETNPENRLQLQLGGGETLSSKDAEAIDNLLGIGKVTTDDQEDVIDIFMEEPLLGAASSFDDLTISKNGEDPLEIGVDEVTGSVLSRGSSEEKEAAVQAKIGLIEEHISTGNVVSTHPEAPLLPYEIESAKRRGVFKSRDGISSNSIDGKCTPSASLSGNFEKVEQSDTSELDSSLRRVHAEEIVSKESLDDEILYLSCASASSDENNEVVNSILLKEKESPVLSIQTLVSKDCLTGVDGSKSEVDPTVLSFRSSDQTVHQVRAHEGGKECRLRLDNSDEHMLARQSDVVGSIVTAQRIGLSLCERSKGSGDNALTIANRSSDCDELGEFETKDVNGGAAYSDKDPIEVFSGSESCVRDRLTNDCSNQEIITIEDDAVDTSFADSEGLNSSKTSWDARWLESDNVKKIMRTSKMFTNVRKKMKIKFKERDAAGDGEPVVVEGPSLIGSVEEYRRLVSVESAHQEVVTEGYSMVVRGTESAEDQVSCINQIRLAVEPVERLRPAQDEQKQLDENVGEPGSSGSNVGCPESSNVGNKFGSCLETPTTLGAVNLVAGEPIDLGSCVSPLTSYTADRDSSALSIEIQSVPMPSSAPKENSTNCLSVNQAMASEAMACVTPIASEMNSAFIPPIACQPNSDFFSLGVNDSFNYRQSAPDQSGQFFQFAGSDPTNTARISHNSPATYQHPQSFNILPYQSEYCNWSGGLAHPLQTQMYPPRDDKCHQAMQPTGTSRGHEGYSWVFERTTPQVQTSRDGSTVDSPPTSSTSTGNQGRYRFGLKGILKEHFITSVNTSKDDSPAG